MKYELNGTFKISKYVQKFTKIVEAESEKLARLKVLSKLGSDHRVKRQSIEITEVKENVEKKEK